MRSTFCAVSRKKNFSESHNIINPLLTKCLFGQDGWILASCFFSNFYGPRHRLSPDQVGHAPNCIMVETINQSGAGIFLGVNLEEMTEIFAREMKRISISLRVSWHLRVR